MYSLGIECYFYFTICLCYQHFVVKLFMLWQIICFSRGFITVSVYKESNAVAIVVAKMSKNIPIMPFKLLIFCVCAQFQATIYCQDIFKKINLSPGIHEVNIGAVLLKTGSVTLKIQHSLEKLLKINKAINTGIENFKQICLNNNDKKICEDMKQEHLKRTESLNETINALINNINIVDKKENGSENNLIDSSDNMVFRSSISSEEDDIILLTLDFLTKKPMNHSVVESKLHSALNFLANMNNYYENIQFEGTKRHKKKIVMAIDDTQSKLKDGYVSAL